MVLKMRLTDITGQDTLFRDELGKVWIKKLNVPSRLMTSEYKCEKRL